MTNQEFTTEELETEIWRPVLNYDELYSVSHLGRLARLHGLRNRGPARIVQPRPTKRGYYLFNLCRDNVRRNIAAHVLVAAVFLGPRPDDLTVNHKDGNKANNRADNLEYITMDANRAHAQMMGLMCTGERWLRAHTDTLPRGEQSNLAILTETDVIEIRRLYRPYVRGLSEQIATQFGTSQSNVRAIAEHKTWRHVGGQ